MMPWKFRDDISNGSRVIVLTDRHINRHTDTTENNTTLGVRVVKIKCELGIIIIIIISSSSSSSSIKPSNRILGVIVYTQHTYNL